MPRTSARRTPFWHRLGYVSVSMLLVAAGALLHAACEDVTAKGRAAPNQKDLDQALARIDDVVITVGDFQDRINKQSPYVRARYTSLERKKEFLDNLVRFEVLAKEAEKKGLHKDPEVVRTMKQVMIQKLMKDEFDNRVKLEDVTDAECKTYYDAHPEEFNKAEEVRVALILLPTQEKAKKVLEDPRIKGIESAGFRALVAEHSIDEATKDRGGDLRYFDLSTKELPQEIVKAAFALTNIGDVSAPIRTQQGWNVIKLTGRRKAVTRSLDDVKPQIKNRLFRDKRQAAMDDYIKDLRNKATVEVHEARLAKVIVEGGNPNAPGVPAPGPGMFHPGANSPQAGPMMPGNPPGANAITVPSSKPAPPANTPVPAPGPGVPSPMPSPEPAKAPELQP
jgi:peptidyl-prolyl cis-trans isomerase C